MSMDIANLFDLGRLRLRSQLLAFGSRRHLRVGSGGQ
jgi:hypothetical protein